MRKIGVFIATFLFFIIMGLIGLYSDLLLSIIHGYTGIDKYRHVKPVENTSLEREVIFFEDPFTATSDNLREDLSRLAGVTTVDYWPNRAMYPKMPHAIYEDTIESILSSPDGVILAGVDLGATYALEIASDSRVQKKINGLILQGRGHKAPRSYENIVLGLCKGACFVPDYPALMYTSVFNNNFIDASYSQDMLSHNGSITLMQVHDFANLEFRKQILRSFIESNKNTNQQPKYYFETDADFQRFKEFEKNKPKEEDIMQQGSSEIDLVSDTSITKFIAPGVGFNNKEYIPKLTPVIDENIIDTKGSAQMRPEAFIALKNMAQQYARDTGEKMVVVSSYRSYTYQKGIKDRGCPDSLCSRAGESEHQSGLAIDLWDASDETTRKTNPSLIKRYEWLKDNAHKYGFHNSYQKGKDIDGYDVEPWHWRYVGTDLAKELHDKGITFTQYYYQNKEKQQN